MTRPATRLCTRCQENPVTRGHGAKYCDPCRDADQHRNSWRTRGQIIVMVDCEGRQDDQGMHLWTTSYGREDGTSSSIIATSAREALQWLITELTGYHENQIQVVTAFHFNWDMAVLSKDFDPIHMELVHKAHARQRGLICGTAHPGRPCGKLHRYDPLDIQAVISDGGEGDLIAWDPKSELALAGTPRRRFYVEHRPHGDRMEERKVLDIHDIGSAFTGRFEDVLDMWQPPISQAQRDIIAAGKAARQDGFAGWDSQQVATYSETECIAGAMTARMLLGTVKAVSGVAIKPSKLFGSGSIAGEMNKAHGCPAREDTATDDMVDPIATLTYFGGLIETPVVGRIRGQIKEDDLCSAYSANTIQLPCMLAGHGHWHHHKGHLDPGKAGLIGHVLATWSVDTPSTPPFAVRVKSGAVRQPLNGYRIWVSMPEYRAAIREFGPDVTCHAAWWWVQECACPRPWTWLEPLYKARQDIKTRMKSLEPGSPEWQLLNVQQEAIKLILNSCYGKLAQRRPEPGKYTNLHYASFITGSTRAADRERTWALERAGNHIVYQHTDSVLHIGPADLDYSSDLGKFKAEKQSRDMVIIQPGLVTAKEGKTACRGIGISIFKIKAWEWAAETDFRAHPSTWPIMDTVHHRMMSRRLSIALNKPDMAGTFYDHPLHIGVVSGKRDVSKARPVPGNPEAWFLPPIPAVPADEIATLDDIKEFLSAVQRRLQMGEFDD